MNEGENRLEGADENRMRAADLAAISIVSVLLALALSLPSALGTQVQPGGGNRLAADISDTSGGVAATVNGVEIGENAVTAYIEGFRTAQGLVDAQTWGEWLIDAGYSVDTLRNETVDYYVNRELIRQAAMERGLNATSDEVNAAVQAQKDAAGSDEQWRSLLEAAGTSEAEVRSDAEVGLLQQMLAEQLAGDSPEGDGESSESVNLLSVFSEYMTEYKRNSDVDVSPQPDGLSYAIDLAPFEEAARETMRAQAQASEGASALGSSDSDEPDAASGSDGPDAASGSGVVPE